MKSQQKHTSKCKDLEAKKEIELPKRSFRETIRCKFCGNEWHSGDYKATVLPQRVPGKKMLKIIDKKKNGTRLLRKFEEKLLLKYEKERGNKLILFCKVCHKNTFMIMNKPHFSKFMVQPDKKNIDDVEVKTKKKKKKKKKDYLCGLKQSAVSPLITGSRLRKFNTTSPVSTALTISQNADSRIPKSVDKGMKNISVNVSGTPKENSSLFSVKELPHRTGGNKLKKKERNQTKYYSGLQAVLAKRSSTYSARNTLKQFISSLD
ncbi:unnamed protein product [Timema podura]|uniref:Uncharacterized protein n=1 Tax=Timema podura TaxID=61482 RepID=A0ABN7NSD3_TIMPD|nr:unnamed protein product [Timema podura]